MASNYLDVLGQLQAAGLLVDSLETGRMRRCRVKDSDREKRGWYMLHEMRLDDGTDVIVGSYGIWQGANSNTTKVSLQKSNISKEQAQTMRKRLAEDKRRADAARKAEAERAAAKAKKAWAKCQPTGESEYLMRKGVAGYGVRYSPSGVMVIPMLDVHGNIHALQLIRGKNRKPDTREKEYWPAGHIKKGRFHLIGMPVAGGVLLLAEGYSTGASLHAATGLPVAVAFDATNLTAAAEDLKGRYAGLRILVCADDDNTQKCHASPDCKARVWVADGPNCPACGQPHRASNAGVTAASSAAMLVGGAWIAPKFANPAGVRDAWLTQGVKANDFNDLHLAEGLHVVRSQVENRLLELGWHQQGRRLAASDGGGGADGLPAPIRPIDSIDELLERFALVYGQGGAVFDRQEHRLVALQDMGHICLNRALFRSWTEHPDREIVRPEQVGFDPTEKAEKITCNLWAGWPTKPKSGCCDYLLELLWHMCAGEGQGSTALCDWVMCWLAYPLQNPGAKMKTTIVVHGPQGSGKNMFFEAYMAIFDQYGWTIDQSAIEDKFNDWASRKLFLIADEVVARSDLFHVKNKLKAFITGDQIRINPKNMAAYYEANHVNMVFLSNEAMPVVLEEDDRRHAIIWTPEKLPPDFYAKVKAEIENGGVAALYDHLLSMNLGNFTNATLPPETDAKNELIALSLDSPSKFVRAFELGDVTGFPAKGHPALLTPCLVSDMYEAYKTWCYMTGERALPLPRFSNALKRKHKAAVLRKRYEVKLEGGGTAIRGPSSVCYLPGGHELPAGQQELEWLSNRLYVFKTALKDLRGGA